MTHKVTQHRKMEVRHGRAITKARWRLITAYQDKRRLYMQNVRIGPHTHWGRYYEWVNAFERFMIRGLPRAKVPRVVRRSAVANDAPHSPEHALEHAPQGHEAAP